MKKTYQRLPESELDIMLVLWNNTPLMNRMEIVADISDHIIFMDKGLIAVEGTPQEVFASDHVRMKEFLGKFHQG